MKVFKIYTGGYHYVIAAETDELALIHLQEEIGHFELEKPTEEIPESDWDISNIKMYEDNDLSTEPWYVSIRESICGNETQLIFTNDFSLIGW